MTIKVFSRLNVEDFFELDVEKEKRIAIQRELFEQGFTEGLQLMMGHPLRNKGPANGIIAAADSLGIPYVVHGPAENRGVDMGEQHDELRLFRAYRLAYPDQNWEHYNLIAIAEALMVAGLGEKASDRNVILHPGYAINTKEGKIQAAEKIRHILEIYPMNGIYLETVPAYHLDQNTNEILHYAFGGLPEDFVNILDYSAWPANRAVLLDLTHVGVTANLMQERPAWFSQPITMEQLVQRFLKMPRVAPVMHFSGHTAQLWDEHLGFIKQEAQDFYKQGVVKETLEEMSNRFVTATVVLEIGYHELERAKREITHFRQAYQVR